MLDLIIVGAGPRGLAVALEAQKRKLNYRIIDKSPLKSWKDLSWFNFQMRSPISFDLVEADHQEYSLKEFLHVQDYQGESEFITRIWFIKYLNFILSRVEANLIKQDVIVLEDQKVILGNGQTLLATKIVLASGSCPRVLKTDKCNLVFPDRIKDTKNSKLVVVGSGQGAAELVSYFAQKNQVSWLIRKVPTVKQYPIPDREAWGLRDAFSDFFRNLTTLEKINYLKRVKAWQPTVTPYVSKSLTKVKSNFEIKTIIDLQKLNQEMVRADYVLSAIGNEFDLNKTLLRNKVVALDHNPKLPLLTAGFKTSISSVRVTGLGAVFYDGLRQGSVCSSASTAKEILDVD